MNILAAQSSVKMSEFFNKYFWGKYMPISQNIKLAYSHAPSKFTLFEINLKINIKREKKIPNENRGSRI